MTAFAFLCLFLFMYYEIRLIQNKFTLPSKGPLILVCHCSRPVSSMMNVLAWKTASCSNVCSHWSIYTCETSIASHPSHRNVNMGTGLVAVTLFLRWKHLVSLKSWKIAEFVLGSKSVHYKVFWLFSMGILSIDDLSHVFFRHTPVLSDSQSTSLPSWTLLCEVRDELQLLWCFSVQSCNHVDSIRAFPQQWQPTTKCIWYRNGHWLHAVFSPP